jgi:hypothetical protein
MTQPIGNYRQQIPAGVNIQIFNPVATPCMMEGCDRYASSNYMTVPTYPSNYYVQDYSAKSGVDRSNVYNVSREVTENQKIYRNVDLQDENVRNSEDIGNLQGNNAEGKRFEDSGNLQSNNAEGKRFEDSSNLQSNNAEDKKIKNNDNLSNNNTAGNNLADNKNLSNESPRNNNMSVLDNGRTDIQRQDLNSSNQNTNQELGRENFARNSYDLNNVYDTRRVSETTRNIVTYETKVEKKLPEIESPKKTIKLTDEYIMKLESYLDSKDVEKRIIAAKDILERVQEDSSRKDNLALNALTNKMLKDPYQPIRFLALGMLEDRLITGNEETTSILKKVETGRYSKNGNTDQDAIKASSVLLKMTRKVQE